MMRKAFVMYIHPNKHAEYEQRHNPIWSELERTLKEHGGHNYSIFLDAEKNLLFGYVEIESEECWASVAQTEICQKWWEYMSDIMETNPDNSPLSSELKEVFHLH